MVTNPKPSSELNQVSEASRQRGRHGTAANHIRLYDQVWCPEMTVIDLGCGMGQGSRKMAQTAKAVVGVERDPDSIMYCNESPMARVQYALIDVFKFAEVNPSLKFDVCTCIEVIEHIDDYEKLLDIIAGFANDTAYISTIKNTGTKIISPEFHVREWTPDEFKELIRSRWKNVVFHELSHFIMAIAQDLRTK